MSCHQKERDQLAGTGDYPNIPDFSSLRITESTTPSNVCKYCYKAFIDCGCTSSAALGICANIAEESRFRPDIITWDGNKKTGKFGIGGGLCGFYRFGKLPELAQYAKKPSLQEIEKLDNAIRNCGKLPLPTTPASERNSEFIYKNFCNFPYTLKQQVDYMVYIINNKYSGIKSQSNPSSAALWWCRKYEMPKTVTDRWAQHGKTVKKYLNS